MLRAFVSEAPALPAPPEAFAYCGSETWLLGNLVAICQRSFVTFGMPAELSQSTMQVGSLFIRRGSVTIYPSLFIGMPAELSQSTMQVPTLVLL